MIQKKLPITFLATIALFFCNGANAQLYINSATFFIQPGATVTVQGNVTSNTNIQGTGTVILNGSNNQSVDMGGNSIQNLQINNAAGSTLLSNLTVGKSLAFTSGTIALGTYNIMLADTTAVSGEGAGNFIATNGTGQAIVNLTQSNFSSYVVPVGQGTTYRPAILTTTGTHTGSANVGVRVATAGDPNKPPMISDYLLAYWPITQTGISGTLNVTGQYNGTSDISGSQSNLKGYFYNGTDWSSASGTSTTGSNQIATAVTGNGDVYGMDGFIVLKAKVFLQGAYNTSTDLMNETLRADGYIPTSDPYRTAPYSTVFTHINNANTETTTSSVLATQTNTNNDIVDWVFLQLRNTTTPGNAVVQTRSVLLQRDGDIVDVDGVSPVTFNNLIAGSYVVTVMHRNHLPLSLNPVNASQPMIEKQSTSTLLDFTTATSTNLLGTAGTNYYNNGTLNMLYAGNANMNANVKYSGGGNDAAAILTLLGGVSTANITGYSVGDLNMNGVTKYSGGGNDAAFILSPVLTGVASTSNKAQILPN